MNALTRSWPAAVLVTAVLAGPAPADTGFPPADPESHGISSAALEALADIVRGYVEQDTIVGAELAVIKDRHLVFHEAFGLRNREQQVPWTKNTICNIRSMSKCLTGAAAEILIDEGRLGIDDPVAKYLPSFENNTDPPMTVRHLLTHRSGLPLTMMDRMYNEYDSLREIADMAGERGPDFEPGSEFLYSDTGSDVLGAVIEVASGQPLQSFIEQRLLEPLGMTDTFTYSDPLDPRRDRIATLYGGAQGNWMRFWGPEDTPLYPWGAGSQSLYSTPLDYARFLAMWMDGGKSNDTRVLAAKAVQRMLTPVSELPMTTGFPGTRMLYGQMAILYTDEDAGLDAKPIAFGRNGSDGTWAYAWPDRDLMVLYYTQSRGQATGTRLEEAIDRLLLHPGQQQVKAEIPPRYKPYLGVYVADFAAFNNEDFTVKVVNGGVAVDIPSQLVLELNDPDSEGRWVFKMTDEIAVTFERDGDGNVHLMKIHQAGYVFDVPRKGSALAAKMAKAKRIAEGDVRDFIGWYYHPERDTNVEVVWRGDRLWLLVPSVPDLELLPPDAKGRWGIRLDPRVLLSFERNGDGGIVSMTRWVGEATLVMPRVEGKGGDPDNG
jgi:CubicO group peptidase (beta-lactamase class C family)